jgi:hypothetical protein
MSQPMYPGSPPQPGMYPPGGPAPGGAKKMSTTTLIIIIVAVVVVGGLLVAAVLGVFAYRGMQTYLSESKSVEGKVGVGSLARGVVVCAEEASLGTGNEPALAAKGLPPTSAKVPASLSSIKGAAYMSAPSDWSDPAFQCARFQMTSPQRFQYQWVLTHPGRKGTARAEGDLDGDGAVDVVFEQDVECTGGGAGAACTPGRLREKRM